MKITMFLIAGTAIIANIFLLIGAYQECELKLKIAIFLELLILITLMIALGVRIYHIQ